MTRAIVHVLGGVADVAYREEGVEVHILDFDNYQEELDMGSSQHGYYCPHCNNHGSDFEWNSATIYKGISNRADRIQRGADDDIFACAFCLHEYPYRDLRRV